MNPKLFMLYIILVRHDKHKNLVIKYYYFSWLWLLLITILFGNNAFILKKNKNKNE